MVVRLLPALLAMSISSFGGEARRLWLAFVPLTHSVFWGTLAYTLIGGTFAGTILTLVFLPALYAIWFKIAPTTEREFALSIRTAHVA